jgi:ParB-like chromosome segregation protein Spo0J
MQELIQVPIGELTIDPANARKHSNRNLESIAASLKRFGQQKPIVIDKAKVVRAGNGTLQAAISLGWETIGCVMTELTGPDAMAYAIADNRTAELAEWDDPVLKATLESLEDFDKELLDACGYTSEELDELIESESDQKEITEDEVPEPPVDPITKPGDLWILGRHRVLCGDSTKAEDVARLMDGAKADMCFTSPPYCAEKQDGATAKSIITEKIAI